MEEKYKNRESRPEDLQLISELKDLIAERDQLIKKLIVRILCSLVLMSWQMKKLIWLIQCLKCIWRNYRASMLFLFSTLFLCFQWLIIVKLVRYKEFCTIKHNTLLQKIFPYDLDQMSPISSPGVRQPRKSYKIYSLLRGFLRLISCSTEIPKFRANTLTRINLFRSWFKSKKEWGNSNESEIRS